VGGFSLGMGQRLGIASALLGDPGILILDEPVNGLDPDGILWIRNLLRSLASEGRTVLVSSHLMSEMALTADQLIIVGKGALLADDSVENVVQASGHNSVRVRTPQADELVTVLASEGLSARKDNANQLTVDSGATDRIGDLAARHRITVHELTLVQASLEEAYMELTHDSLTYQAEPFTSLNESAA
jgi:ABC-2 type transport system ATP-binding protein